MTRLDFPTSALVYSKLLPSLSFFMYFFKFLVLGSLFLHTGQRNPRSLLNPSIMSAHVGQGNLTRGIGISTRDEACGPRGTLRNPKEPRNPEKLLVNLNLKPDEATKVEKFNFLISNLK